MRGRTTGFWGKLDRDAAGVVTGWHPLFAHCADVAACAEVLLTRTLVGKRLAVLAGRSALGPTDIARLCVLAALHDIGKFNLGFQRKGDADQRDVAGHVREVLALFASNYRVAEQLMGSLPVNDLNEWCPNGGALELLVAAIAHHGRPVRCDELSPNPSIWTASVEFDPFAGIADLVARARSWFPSAFSSQTSLPDAAAFQHGFSGLVMLADWLGSDRNIFPFAESLDDRIAFARAAAARAVMEIGLDVCVARASLGAKVPGFDRISAFSPREAQSATLALPRPPTGDLSILESETGSGKTEAALCRFIQLFHAGLVDGMVFALPTRTAATQLHRRVVDAMKLAFPIEAVRPAVVLAVPGYLQFDETHGRRLPEFEVLWNDDPKARLRHRGWPAEHPKRYLAGTIVVGTIDQVLLSSLRVSHAHLRATALLRHLLVVDEVHASDAYMNRILEEVLGFHLAAGGHAILMSATLGSHVRRKLERAVISANKGDKREESLEAALATPYPVVHHVGDGPPTMVAIGAPSLPKTVLVALEPLADDPGAVASRALNAARQGARVLVLRNTVTDAVATQLALEELATRADEPLLFRVANVVTLHTARFAKDDRERLDDAIEDRFGKGAAPQGGVVAVATQTVQQSLDLDADILFTDLAPMDVLLQRMGRLHRHAERHGSRPADFEAARAVVMTAEAPLEGCILANGKARGRHGFGTVYDDLTILEATRQRLQISGTLRIPGQNRELVESTTHPEALEKLVRSLGERWLKHRIAVLGVEMAHSSLAGLNVVERDQRFGEYSFKNTDLGERISARLGESDRRAVFADPQPGPFGGRVRELTLPGWMMRDVPSDSELVPTDVRVGSGAPAPSIRFAFGPVRFVYDRLGLRRDETASTDPTEDIADA